MQNFSLLSMNHHKTIISWCDVGSKTHWDLSQLIFRNHFNWAVFALSWFKLAQPSLAATLLAIIFKQSIKTLYVKINSLLVIITHSSQMSFLLFLIGLLFSKTVQVVSVDWHETTSEFIVHLAKPWAYFLNFRRAVWNRFPAPEAGGKIPVSLQSYDG